MSVGGAVELSIDAEVPFDAGVERRARQIAAADKGDAVRRRLEAPGLRVERARQPGQLIDLDHTRLERARWGTLQRRRFILIRGSKALLPIEQTLERRHLRHIQIVAGENPHAGAPPQRRLQVGLNSAQPSVEHERCDDGDLGGGGKERQDVPRERVVDAPRDEAANTWGTRVRSGRRAVRVAFCRTAHDVVLVQ